MRRSQGDGTGIKRRLALLSLAALAAPAMAEPQPVVVTGRYAQSTPDLFGTVAIPIDAGRYAEGWRRARLDASHMPQMARLIAPAVGQPRERQVAFIQAAVHRQIRWMSDATEWGRHDYWASAAQTLARGAGDMEDRAILKMQALRALGFSPRDLYLTMGRDKVGGPITVLMVRAGQRLLVLDDLGGAPIPIERREGFEPVITFGNELAWIHGRRVARAHASAGGSLIPSSTSQSRQRK